MKRVIIILTVAVLLGGAIFVVHYLTRKGALAKRTACVGSLIRIRLTKLVYAADNGMTNGAVIPDEVIWRENGLVERCHSGGQYSINAVGVNPSCSYTGVVQWSGRLHLLPE